MYYMYRWPVCVWAFQFCKLRTGGRTMSSSTNNNKPVKDSKKPTHPSYIKMIIEAILSTTNKMAAKESIKQIIQSNYSGLSRLNTAMVNALDKGIKNNTLKYDEDKGYSVVVQAKKKATNKKKKKKKRTQNNNKITPPFRKYKYAYSRTQCCEEHVISPEHIKGGLKMMKKHIDAAEKTAEPWEDRKVIYSKVAEYLRVQGYWFYGQGHALPGIFREKLKEAIPGDQHL
eukprot:220202_1